MTALPSSLDHFGGELENAAGRELRKTRRRRRTIRGAAVLAVVAAAALGLLSVFGTGGPSVVERAAAALQVSDDSILHYGFDATQQNGDGTIATWQQETWQLLVPPYTRRQIAIDSGAPRAESMSRGDLNELYDASKDTIYSATSEELRAARMPDIEIVSKSKLEQLTGSTTATAVYEVGKGDAPYKVVATEAGARKLRQQISHPQGQTSGPLPAEFRSEILALLESGKVEVVGHVEVDGRDAIKLESLSGKSTYIVDASTYDPIEWTTTGTDGGVALHFRAYDELPVDTESMRLLSLRDQHPNAQVVRGAKAYMAAESRLYPHG
jgi:outer membrane lipoprotein-sorting protein